MNQQYSQSGGDMINLNFGCIHSSSSAALQSHLSGGWAGAVCVQREREAAKVGYFFIFAHIPYFALLDNNIEVANICRDKMQSSQYYSTFFTISFRIISFFLFLTFNKLFLSGRVAAFCVCRCTYCTVYRQAQLRFTAMLSLPRRSNCLSHAGELGRERGRSSSNFCNVESTQPDRHA